MRYIGIFSGLGKNKFLIEIRVHWILADANAEYFPIFKTWLSTFNLSR